MLQFFTSLTFLYLFTIVVLMLYGLVFYRDFKRDGYQRKRFPYVFLLIGAACFWVLFMNIHAPLKLKTFSNLDHHFLRHDGFQVARKIELGRTDTLNNPTNTFNRFLLVKEATGISVSAEYSEEPLYAGASSSKLLSASFPASGHTISIKLDTMILQLRPGNENSLELIINNNTVCKLIRTIKKGSSAWNILKDEESFINSSWYTKENLSNALKNIFLLRDNAAESGELRLFVSGKVFRYGTELKFDEKKLGARDLVFRSTLADGSVLGWGIGFPDNNKNQFRVKYGGKDSFSLLSRYPVSYPMTSEKKLDAREDEWQQHIVNKFIVSDSKDLLKMSPVFGEGFLFTAFQGDSSIDFSPALLSYVKGGGNEPLQLKANFMDSRRTGIRMMQNKIALPARSGSFSWIFSVRNSFDWDFGARVIPAKQWELLVFGSLAFFFVMVFFSSLLKPANKLSWVWQILSAVTIVLLTTRFFLYWRYKSFPPYEGLDLPSQQQLQSFWNFGIVIVATILLAIIFGYGLLVQGYKKLAASSARLLNQPYDELKTGNGLPGAEKISVAINQSQVVRKMGAKLAFFASWFLILAGCAGLAAIRDFDPGICRHLSIGLILLYFIYVYISYKHSPLVASSEKSWWGLRTGKPLDIIISNPVKVLLSISMLAVFVFIDIGFAIVFLNFLLFNEAFLCINYSIAGYSAGSRKNAGLFGLFGFLYLSIFLINLLYAPAILNEMLDLPQTFYLGAYILFAFIIAQNFTRLLSNFSARKKALTGFAVASLLLTSALLFFPKDKILEKAEITRYRINVMSMPVDKAIESAYRDGKTWEPVIRAAQNQWFINTFIYEKNNPAVQKTGFQLLPHSPQNKGAKYNAQASDLVTSRFFIAEHGKLSVLLFVLLLMLPITLLASFYKLYPDFTNRINSYYPTITAGFSVLNYLLITAMLVILAATGRYIFFGQDLPFGSIISKQSVLFPSILIIAAVLLFRNIQLEYYPNRRKLIPGLIVLSCVGGLLFLVKPVYNKNRDFTVNNLARDMDAYIQMRLQPVLDHFDTSPKTRRLSFANKDRLFTDSLRKLVTENYMADASGLFNQEIESYTRSGFNRHLDQRKLLYLDLYSGRPQLAVNDNYFHIEPPPHLQQYWTGNVFGDSTVFNLSYWDSRTGYVAEKRLDSYTNQPLIPLAEDLDLSFRASSGENLYGKLWIVNKGKETLHLNYCCEEHELTAGDSIQLFNPDRISITGAATKSERILVIEPDAFMKNYYVNGGRYFIYPMENRFIWARNFSESVSSEYTRAGTASRNAFLSFDFELMDTLSAKIRKVIGKDTAYKKGSEYGICIADGNGRLVAMTDFIKDFNRPDPNDKAGFIRAIQGENGFISQSLLRKQIGNINLLRMNPGPGSTFKPIVFSAIASQLNIDWGQFGSIGFSEKQEFYGGEKVAEYDFENYNGPINKVSEYFRVSDNYYHSNVLLLGSYPRQDLSRILTRYFATNNPDPDPDSHREHWPYFTYQGQSYWLNGFENWPAYLNGKADFGSDSSFTSIGLNNNYGIYTKFAGKSFDKFSSTYDSTLFGDAYRKSGFILPEYGLWDQQATQMDHHKPNELFMAGFKGHVKGSSQLMVPPLKMLDAYGKLITQSKNYSLTLNPYALPTTFSPFEVQGDIVYNNYLSVIREDIFTGMHDALYKGTAARLGLMLKDAAPYYFYAKTGTTGDNEAKTKSKLFTFIISSKDIRDPGFNFRNNKFYTIYFTSQNGPAKQNEEFQAAVIKYVLQSGAFKKYMKEKEF